MRTHTCPVLLMAQDAGLSSRRCRVQFPHGVLHGLLVKLDITRRFERLIPGSNPGRATYKRDEGEMAPRLVWDQETAGSSPAIPTCGHFNTARSFNGRGRRPDKAETKVRLLLGLFKQQTTEPDMLTLHRLKQIPTPHTRSWCNGSTADF